MPGGNKRKTWKQGATGRIKGSNMDHVKTTTQAIPEAELVREILKRTKDLDVWYGNNMYLTPVRVFEIRMALAQVQVDPPASDEMTADSMKHEATAVLERMDGSTTLEHQMEVITRNVSFLKEIGALKNSDFKDGVIPDSPF